MEDATCLQAQLGGYSGLSLFAVFDGHAGKICAEYARDHLPLNFLTVLSRELEGESGETILEGVKSPPSRIDTATDPDIELSVGQEALRNAFESTDADFLRMAEQQQLAEGATGVVAVILGNMVLVGNAGDSRAVLSRGGTAFPLSFDHKPGLEKEKKRVMDAGGFVTGGRVMGMLAVSRALGDMHFKKNDHFPIPLVTASPELVSEFLAPEDEFLILACDGLWDVISNQDAVDLVKGFTDPEEAAAALVEAALKAGTLDNVSAIVVFLRHL
jgi:protein phosphatase 1L